MTTRSRQYNRREILTRTNDEPAEDFRLGVVNGQLALTYRSGTKTNRGTKTTDAKSALNTKPGFTDPGMVWNGSSQSTAAEIARMQAHADKMWGRGSAACAKPQEITAIEEASRRSCETPT